MSSLSGKSVGQFRFFYTNYEWFLALWKLFFFMLQIFRWEISSNYLVAGIIIKNQLDFHQISPLGQFCLVVEVSVWRWRRSPPYIFFLGLSLALRSHDQLKVPSTVKWAHHLILFLDGNISRLQAQWSGFVIFFSSGLGLSKYFLLCYYPHQWRNSMSPISKILREISKFSINLGKTTIWGNRIWFSR